MFKNRVLIIGPKWEEEGVKSNKVLNEELINFCLSTNTVRTITLWGMYQARVTCTRGCSEDLNRNELYQN